jgi:hypothetical protein
MDMINGNLIMGIVQIVGSAAAIIAGIVMGLRDRKAPRDKLDEMFEPYR